MSKLDCSVREMQASDLGMVLAWRNHPDVRRYMYNSHIISIDEHACWFESASTDPKRHLLVFEIETTPLGFINIHQVASGGIADWGFYVAPEAPKGTGRVLGNAALKYAFKTMGFKKLCGQVLAYNERSIRFHLSLGFQREGVFRKQYFDGEHYYDIICFGLLANEWHKED